MAKFLKLLILTALFSRVDFCAGDEAFATTEARLGSKKIVIEVADTPEKREKGLMHRRTMDQDRGMLFVFDFEQTLTFWMKNTLIPLSIGYLDSNLRLFEVLDMQPEPLTVIELRRYPSRKPARFALEMNQGWFKRNKIELGAQLRLTGKSLPQSLKPFKQIK